MCAYMSRLRDYIPQLPLQGVWIREVRYGWPLIEILGMEYDYTEIYFSDTIL